MDISAVRQGPAPPESVSVRGTATADPAGSTHRCCAGSRRASRRVVLHGLLGAIGGAASLLASCTAPAPRLPFGPRPASLPVTLVVGDAYVRVTGNPQDRNSLVTVADATLQKWAATAQERLQGRAMLGVRVADLAHETLWLDATLAGGTVTGEQPLYLASHAMLWRLRGGGIVADLGARVARDHALAAGSLHPDTLDCFRWRHQLAGLPIALWPALMATDARLPAPPAGWTWDDAVRLRIGSGAWPVQLLPDAPPLEAWLWPHGADVVNVDGTQALLAQANALTALHAYATAFGPIGSGALSPVPGGGLGPTELATLRGPWTPDYDAVLNAWARRTLTQSVQQVRQRRVGAWFPVDEWPPVATGPHQFRDDTGPLQRLAPPGAQQAGVPTTGYGLGIRADAAHPDLLYQAARALQDAAPGFLAYSPFLADQTAAALRRRWSALTADQAATLAAVLRLRLRPVWDVTSARLLRNPFLPGFLPDATQAGRLSREIEQDSWDVPKRVEGLLQSLSIVVALGILPSAAATPNVAHELQNLLELWATPA